jgi:opacity protein-like surface antigen
MSSSIFHNEHYRTHNNLTLQLIMVSNIRRFFVTLLVLYLYNGCSIANAKSDVYLSFLYGPSFTNKMKYDDSYYKSSNNPATYSVSIGRYIGESGFRSELNYAYKNQRHRKKYYADDGIDGGFHSQDISTQSYFLKLYKEFYDLGNIYPYLGCGIGVSKIRSGELKFQTIEEDGIIANRKTLHRTSYTIGGGIKAKISNKISLTIFDYTLNWDGKYSIKNIQSNENCIISIKSHSLKAGITFKF